MENNLFPIKPYGDRFVGEVLECDEELHIQNSEFILPKNDNSRPMRLKVIEISDTFDNSGLGLKNGDIVLVSKYGTTAITYGEPPKKYQLCCKMDIIGIL